MSLMRRAHLAALASQAATRPPALGEHSVTNLVAWKLREPTSHRAYTVIRVDTASGLKGYGECADLDARELRDGHKALLGVPATAVESSRARLRPYPNLQAAANIALLDIVGKAARAPLFQVLGGPTRNKVRALAPLWGTTDAELRASLEIARSVGHRAFLVPAPVPASRNQGQAYVRAVRSRMDALRTAAGDQCDFVLGAASSLTPGDAAGISAAMERSRLLWLDEPCPVSNLAAVRKLASENVTPLGFGSTVDDAGGFQDLLREDAIDILRPDLSRHGITQIRRIAALVETYYIAVAPYHAGGPIGTAAALHLAASLPNFFIQQLPFAEAPAGRQMRTEIAGGSLEKPSDGFLALPTGPGLGITINEEALRKYEERAA